MQAEHSPADHAINTDDVAAVCYAASYALPAHATVNLVFSCADLIEYYGSSIPIELFDKTDRIVKQRTWLFGGRTRNI